MEHQRSPLQRSMASERSLEQSERSVLSHFGPRHDACRLGRFVAYLFGALHPWMRVLWSSHFMSIPSLRHPEAFRMAPSGGPWFSWSGTSLVERYEEAQDDRRLLRPRSTCYSGLFCALMKRQKGGGVGTHFQKRARQSSHAREYDFGVQSTLFFLQ